MDSEALYFLEFCIFLKMIESVSYIAINLNFTNRYTKIIIKYSVLLMLNKNENIAVFE